MSGITFGNTINPQGGFSGEYFPLPGYRIYKTSAYAALRPVLDNRFRLKVPTKNRTEPPKNLTLPLGASIFSVGVRAGNGVWNELTGSELHLGYIDVNGNMDADAHVKLHGFVTTGGAANEGVNLPPHMLFGINDGSANGLPLRGATDHSGRSVWLRDVGNLSAENLFDVVNVPLKVPSGFASYDAIGLPETLTGRKEFELQVRATGGATLVPIGAGLGGLRQIVGDKNVENKGVVIVDVGWYIRDDSVTEIETFNINWDEIFRNLT